MSWSRTGLVCVCGGGWSGTEGTEGEGGGEASRLQAEHRVPAGLILQP